ncbi:MAG: endonuclease domain-containing protein [Candidatus Kerfeldbacteria bacterium]|nr:endonuclease domain-containing protein [Candidatus Kerfeldbacteria bacterium]
MPPLFNLPTSKDCRRALRRHRSRAEIILWRHLRNRLFHGFRFRRQYGIGHFIVDFYCPKLELVIEVDGDFHFGPESEAYDTRRTLWLQSHGIRVIRFTNQDVMDDIEEVLKKIRASISTSPNPFPSCDGTGSCKRRGAQSSPTPKRLR